MKTLGYVALVVGVIWLLVAFNLDTSVSTGYGTRVNNIGLMASKQNHILIGAFITFCGLLMAIFSKRSVATAKCPFCAELINPEAIKCKHCGSDVSEHMKRVAEPIFCVRHVDYTMLIKRDGNSLTLDGEAVNNLVEKMKVHSKSTEPGHILGEYQEDINYLSYLLPSSLQGELIKRIKQLLYAG